MGGMKLNVLGISFEADSIINTEYGDRVFNKKELEKDFAEIAKHIESLDWIVIGEHRRGRFDKPAKNSKNKISISATFTNKTTPFSNICGKIEMMKDMRAHIIGVIIDKNKESKICDLILHSLISKSDLKELKFKVRSLGFFIPSNLVSDDTISKYILNEELKKIYGRNMYPISLNRSDEPAKEESKKIDEEDPDSKITDDEICFMRFILNGINDENSNLFPFVKPTIYSIRKGDITDGSIGCVTKTHVLLIPEISYDHIKDFALNTIGFSSFPSEEDIIKRLKSHGLLENLTYDPYKVSMIIDEKEHKFYMFRIDDVMRIGSMHLKVRYKKEESN